MINDLRLKLRDLIEKFLGDICRYFKRVSIMLHLWLIYSTLRSFGCILHCLEAQIASNVAFVDAYNGEKQWLQNHQNVSLSLTTCVFEPQIASIIALVDAYNDEKQWLQNHQNVSLSSTTCVFESWILDSGTKFRIQLCIETKSSKIPLSL